MGLPISLRRISNKGNEDSLSSDLPPLLSENRSTSSSSAPSKGRNRTPAYYDKGLMETVDQLHSEEKSTTTPATWLPYTLRWQYILLPTLINLSLLVVIPILTWHSKTHHGLGNDDESSIVLFGWRFMPTLIAVLYTQLTAMILDDVKRTEPFARMDKAGPKGATAASTILQKRTAWWSALADGFSKEKNAGKRSLALICSATLNIIAFLLISPFSSSLLSTRTTSVPEPIEFNTMMPANGKQIPLHPGRDTYLRTTSNFLANVSSTPWITESFIVLPFWPSSQGPTFGQNMLDHSGSWQANTTVLSSDMACSNMSLVNMRTFLQENFQNVYDCTGSSPGLNFTCTDGPLGDPVESKVWHVPSISASFESAGGCRYELEFPELELYNEMDSAGFGTWTNISQVADIYSADNPKNGSGNWTRGRHTSANHSEACGDKEIIMFTTPWSLETNKVPDNQNDTNSNSLKDVTLQCLLCSHAYKMATVPVTFSRASDTIQVTVPENDFRSNSVPIPETLLNSSTVQALSLAKNWSTAVGGTQNVRKQQELVTAGMASVVAARFNNNLTDIIGDPEVTSEAARLHRRFFYELIYSSVVSPDAFEAKTIRGVENMARKRVVVVTGIGIMLTVLFGVSFILCLILIYYTRLNHRPLNLESDPATTVSLATLVGQDHSTARFREFHQSTHYDFYRILQSQRYYTRSGKLCGVESIPGKERGSFYPG